MEDQQVAGGKSLKFYVDLLMALHFYHVESKHSCKSEKSMIYRRSESRSRTHLWQVTHDVS